MNPVGMLRDGFRGTSLLVVGGKGDIGAAVAHQAAELGACVIVASRSARNDDKPPQDGEIVERQCDATSLESVRGLHAVINDWFGCLDILVNSAGTTKSVPAAEIAHLTDEISAEVFSSNSLAPLRLVREMLPLLQRGLDPVVVHVSSVAARTGQGSNIAYSGAKAALDAMTVAWAKAFAPVRFVNVAPSALSNGFVPDRTPEFLERTVSLTPMARLALADEVAAAILVAARCLTMTTGVTIPVDGGRHL